MSILQFELTMREEDEADLSEEVDLLRKQVRYLYTTYIYIHIHLPLSIYMSILQFELYIYMSILQFELTMREEDEADLSEEVDLLRKQVQPSI